MVFEWLLCDVTLWCMQLQNIFDDMHLSGRVLLLEAQAVQEDVLIKRQNSWKERVTQAPGRDYGELQRTIETEQAQLRSSPS